MQLKHLKVMEDRQTIILFLLPGSADIHIYQTPHPHLQTCSTQDPITLMTSPG